MSDKDALDRMVLNMPRAMKERLLWTAKKKGCTIKEEILSRLGESFTEADIEKNPLIVVQEVQQKGTQ